MAKSNDERFRIDPEVVFKLGQELISDETQALLELIKNAYDADATYVAVRINTRSTPNDLLIEADPRYPGYIEVVDNGTGMSAEQVRDGWLLIARSLKADLKQAGGTTKKKRTPLGDKGLGRLGAQRLGWGLQLATKIINDPEELLLAFSWRDFLQARTLEEVGVRSRRSSGKRQHGTTITITELNDLERWRGEAIKDLQRQLSEVISPYEGISGFRVSVSIDGTPLDLETIREEVLNTAQLHYDIAFDGEELTMEGKARLNFFRPPPGKQREAFAALVEPDEGAEFRDRLLADHNDKGFQFAKGRRPWYLTFRRRLSLASVVEPLPPDDVEEGEQQTEESEERIPSPGPFHARVDAFDLSSGSDERAEVFGTLNPYKDFIKRMSGIRVYRNGFGVRVDSDWLGLGEQATSGKSSYGLKQETTLGYVALSARDNPDLVEKTDREGFTDTPEYRALRELMREFRRFSEDAQAYMRREFLKYFKEKQAERAEAEEDESAEELSEGLDKILNEAGEAKGKVEASQEDLREAATKAEAALAEEAEGTDSKERSEAVAQLATDLRSAIDSNEQVVAEVSAVLAKLESAKARNEMIRQEVEVLREQLKMGVEAMGLGLTAEALSHEMFQIADGLSARTQQLQEKLDAGELDPREVKSYLENVRGSVGVLRRELGHFSPSMRYVRQRRDNLQMGAVVEDIAAYYGSHWAGEAISLKVKDASRGGFDVRINRGRINQVFDNLIINSHYWLQRAIRNAEIDKGNVTIRLRAPHVFISDNGPGVDPSVEDSLFEPFTTRKPQGKGRGLGLFIVRQLMEAEGCSVELGPKRNSAGRRYEFQLDFTGVLDDD
ncbi:MAG TPA: sensor histidine kinase [Solirubrobacterales bacterium]